MHKLKRAGAGLLAIVLLAMSLSVLATPKIAQAASVPSYWGDDNTSYGNNIKKVDPRIDRQENFYLQVDFTNAPTADYLYKSDSADYATDYAPYQRLVTFVSGSGNTLTGDICMPKQILIGRDDGDGIGKKPSRYYFADLKNTTVGNFRDEMINFNKKYPGTFSASHLKYLQNGACDNVKPLDLTPLVSRQIKAKIHLHMENDTTDNRNVIQATNKGITSDDLLKRLYFCLYNRDTKKIAVMSDGTTQVCRPFKGATTADILDDKSSTQKELVWNSPDISAGNYDVFVLGVPESKFNRPFNFGDTGKDSYKSYAIAQDTDLSIDYVALLNAVRGEGGFDTAVTQYEAKPQDQREPPVTENTDTGGDGSIGCETDWNPLSWVFCGIVNGAKTLIDTLDAQIVNQLNIPNEEYFDVNGTEAGHAFYNVWTNFRNIGLVLLLIAALVMVISQALSIGPFDAYTVKKVLPRILVAIIFMTLSWDICRFLVGFANEVGFATRALIQAPFNSLNIEFHPGTKATAALLAVGAQQGAAAGFGLGALGLLSFVGTAALAVFIAFIVIMVRKILVVFMVLIAPFAIAAYILPNTQKFYKLWWDTFSKALMMFPIVMGFIAVGRVFAAVTSATGNQSLPTQLITLIAYFGPYFALPMAFRMAGGAIATISGMANDRSKGAFDRLKKGRQERSKHRRELASNSSLYNKNNAAVQWMKKHGVNVNEIAGSAVVPGKALQYAARNQKIPGLSAAGRRIASSIEGSKLEQSQKLMQHWNAHGANDKFYRAVSGLYNGMSKETQQKLIDSGMAERVEDANGNWVGTRALKSLSSENDFHKMADILETSGSDSERKAATALRANAAYTAGLYADTEMSYADTQAAGAYGLAAHNFFDDTDAADTYNLIKSQGGHDDYAHAVTVNAENIGKGGHPEAKPGYGHEVINGRAVAATDDLSDRGWAVWETLDAGALSGSKGNVLDPTDNFGALTVDMLKIGGGDVVHKQKVEARITQAMKKEGFSDAEIKSSISKRMQKAGAQYESMRKTLAQVAGDWSQANTSARTNATRILQEAGLGADIQPPTPAQIAQMGAMPQQPPEPPPGGGDPAAGGGGGH